MTIASNDNKPKNASASRRRLTTAEASQRLYRLASSQMEPDEKLSEIVEIAANLTGALGVIFLARSEEHDGRLSISPQLYSPPHLAHLRSLLQHVSRLGAVAAAEEKHQAGSAESGDEIIVVAVPVMGHASGTEAIAAAIGVESEAQARSSAAYLTQVLTWIAAYISPLRDESVSKLPQETTVNLRRVNQLLHECSQQQDLGSASQLLADWVRDETHCSTAIVGMRRGWQRHCQVAGLSGSKKFDERTATIGYLREMLEETVIASDSPSTAKDDSLQEMLDASLLETAAVSNLRRATGLEVAERYALYDAKGNPYGAILCLQDSAVDHANVKHIPSETLKVIGEHFSLLKAAEPSTVSRTLGLHKIQKRWYRHPFTWSTLVAVSLFMMIPMPLRVKCDCLVQPKHRRFVSVPYEGRLEEALAEPGEIVEKGQLLARMDGREIRWEISALKADLRRAEKDRDTALAAFDTSQSQMSGLESKRLRLQIESLQERLQNLEIRSPVDGIVMGGDPRKLEGARLSIGETLLEVGPMNEMTVELEIADEDISHIAEQQPVSYRLAALPWQTFEGPITLIHPRSESRDGRNVFVAEVGLNNDESIIRPGMHGRAKIRGGYHPLGWNLFHKAWDGLVSWVAW